MFKNKKGLTLAELLIVVAIIAVLTAIAIPVFTSQLNKAKLATDHANIRGAQAVAAAANLTGEITVDDVTKPLTDFMSKGTNVVYTKDGKLSTNFDNAYTFQASGSSYAGG